MNRRAFLTIVGGGIFAVPFIVLGQEAAKTSRIGVLGPTPIAPLTDEAFRRGLAQFGYTDGRNLVIEYRDAEGTRLSDVAGELVRLNVDVIYARGPAAVKAAKEATRTIPVVAIDLESDPLLRDSSEDSHSPAAILRGSSWICRNWEENNCSCSKRLYPSSHGSQSWVIPFSTRRSFKRRRSRPGRWRFTFRA